MRVSADFSVSTHVVCERLSVMQDLAWACRIFGSICQEYPILGKELPPIPEMKIWSGLGTLSWQEYPSSPNENSIRIWDFEFWVAKNTPPPSQKKFGKDLGLRVLSCQKYPLTTCIHFKYYIRKCQNKDGCYCHSECTYGIDTLVLTRRSN